MLPRAVVYDASLTLSLPVPVSVASGLNALARSGLHHKICHVLGGMYNVPHAQTQAIVLPYVLALNAPSVPETEQRMAAAFGAAFALGGLQRLREQVEAPRVLRDYGLREIDIPAAVEAMAAVPPRNPAPVTTASLKELLYQGREGRRPL